MSLLLNSHLHHLNTNNDHKKSQSWVQQLHYRDWFLIQPEKIHVITIILTILIPVTPKYQHEFYENIQLKIIQEFLIMVLLLCW